MSEYAAQLNAALEAALAGGDFLRAAFHSGHNQVDGEAERIIRDVLTARYPNYGYCGEETGRAAPRTGSEHLWLVDPLDGTSAFHAGHRGPSVSIALLQEGRPVLGVIYAFSWPDDEGELFAWAEGMPHLLRNGCAVPFHASSAPDTIAISQDADRKARANAELVAPLRYRAVASIALRLALVAAGEARAGNSLNGPVGWDYAAGHALLGAAGLELVDGSGRPIRYSRAGESLCDGTCTGGPGELARELSQRAWDRVFQQPKDPVESYHLCSPDRQRLIADAGLLRRAQGCLLGQLAGDALGSLVEFLAPEEIASRYPGGLRILADGGTHQTIAGQPTDDSEMALIQTRAILQSGRYDPEALARAYRWWYDSGPFDVGFTVATALRAGGFNPLREVGSFAEACRRAANPRSKANGALMRVAPLGILGACAPPGSVSQWADEDAQLTHPNPECRHANSVFAASLAFAIRNGADARATYEFALAEARRIGAEANIRRALERAGSDPPQDFITHQGYVVVAFQNAFYQALHAASLEEGIVDTVMRGGDTDTNAAIAGALLGAIHGRSAVPFEWLDRVLTCRPIRGLAGVHRPRPKAFWPVDALTVAEQLLWLGRNQG